MFFDSFQFVEFFFSKTFSVHFGVNSSETQLLGFFSGASPCLTKRIMCIDSSIFPTPLPCTDPAPWHVLWNRSRRSCNRKRYKVQKMPKCWFGFQPPSSNSNIYASTPSLLCLWWLCQWVQGRRLWRNVQSNTTTFVVRFLWLSMRRACDFLWIHTWAGSLFLAVFLSKVFLLEMEYDGTLDWLQEGVQAWAVRGLVFWLLASFLPRLQRCFRYECLVAAQDNGGVSSAWRSGEKKEAKEGGLRVVAA